MLRFNLFSFHFSLCIYLYRSLNVYKKISFLCCAGCFVCLFVLSHLNIHLYPIISLSHRQTTRRIKSQAKLQLRFYFIYRLFSLEQTTTRTRTTCTHEVRVKRQARCWKPSSSSLNTQQWRAQKVSTPPQVREGLLFHRLPIFIHIQLSLVTWNNRLTTRRNKHNCKTRF